MPSVNWSRDNIPDHILDREQKTFASFVPMPKSIQAKSSTMPAKVLAQLIEECDREGITHLSVADLKLALSRWIG